MEISIDKVDTFVMNCIEGLLVLMQAQLSTQNVCALFSMKARIRLHITISVAVHFKKSNRTFYQQLNRHVFYKNIDLDTHICCKRFVCASKCSFSKRPRNWRTSSHISRRGCVASSSCRMTTESCLLDSALTVRCRVSIS